VARRLEHVYQAANMINFILFLKNGWSAPERQSIARADVRECSRLLVSHAHLLTFCLVAPLVPLCQLSFPPRACAFDSSPLPPSAHESESLVRVHESADRVECTLGLHALPPTAHQLRYHTGCVEMGATRDGHGCHTDARRGRWWMSGVHSAAGSAVSRATVRTCLLLLLSRGQSIGGPGATTRRRSRRTTVRMSIVHHASRQPNTGIGVWEIVHTLLEIDHEFSLSLS
jgi:hypothetical protein